ITICDYVVGKRILFVGPETTYHLHNLWLAALERQKGHSLHCPGAQYCVFHHICNFDHDSSSTMIFDGRKQKLPGSRQLRETGSAILQYTLSSSLATSDGTLGDKESRPLVDQLNDVRVHNSDWIMRFRRADIVVMSRAP
ncbi:hypothetical protein FA15DRAFT_548429, partial [Coprinopsis marcescibilis]